jgi:hypothetical protein
MTGKQVIADWSSEERNTELKGENRRDGEVGYENRDRRGGGVQRGWSGNIEPRKDRIARRSDPDAAELTVAKTVRPGEIFLREQTRGLQDLLRQNPVSLFMLG